MNFQLTAEQRAYVELAQQFAQEEMAPHAAAWDRDCTFPVATLRKAAALGFAAIYIDANKGGTGLSRLEAALVFQALATACPSTTAFLTIHNMCAWMISEYANDAQRQRWLPGLASMAIFPSYCLTEPNAGSDAASLQTSADLIGDEWILNGAKCFISGGSVSDLYLVMARSDGPGSQGISCLLVPKNTPGLRFGKKEVKLGWHSQPTSMVYFDNCRVPADHLIGERGAGFRMALAALNGGRVNIAACSLGGAEACLTASKRYLHERKQFGQTLASLQALQFRYADMVTEWEASKLMVYRAAVSLEHPDENTISHCAMAKRFATDACFAICDQALQLHGGYGYLQDYAIERYLRDLRVHQILEGTNEIMRLIVARHTLNTTT